MLDRVRPSNKQRPNTVDPTSNNFGNHLALGGAPAPPGADLLPFANSRTRVAQRGSLHDWARLHERNDRIRSPGSLWTILHKTPIPNGATWARLIAGLINALEERSGTEGSGFVSWNARWLVDARSVQNVPKKQRIRRWLDAGKVVFQQEMHWETVDLAVWETLFPAATIIASEAVHRAGGVAIIVPPAVEIIREHTLVPGYAILAELRYRGQAIRVLSWYLPPGRREVVMTQISQALPVQGSPLFAGRDLNYHVPAPTPDEHERAQLVRGFLAERSSMCVEFPGPTHGPTEQHAGNSRQLDAFSVPATAIWKWTITPCWTDGQSDHAAIIASLHRRRTSDSGVMSARLVRGLPPIALADLRSRFGLRIREIVQHPWQRTQRSASTQPVRQTARFGTRPKGAIHPEDNEEGDNSQGPSSRNERGKNESNGLNRDSVQPPLSSWGSCCMGELSWRP